MAKTKPVKTSIPRQLHVTLLKLQVDGGLDWDDACIQANTLLDRNSKAFQRAINREAELAYKSRFLTQFNKAKQTVEAGAFERGYREGMDDHEIWYFCSVCGKKVSIQPNDVSHNALIGYMREHGWSHGSCIDKQKT